MLKKAFISLATRRYQKRKKQTSFPGYTEVNAIGILINATEKIPDGIDEFAVRFRNEGKSVDLLFIGDKNTELGPMHITTKDQDFTVFGNPKSSDVIAFTQKKYDLVIVLDHSGNHLVGLLASRSNSSCYVGFNDYPESELLTLRIKPHPNHELDDISRYLKMITHE